jgi:hypothetical protein
MVIIYAAAEPDPENQASGLRAPLIAGEIFSGVLDRWRISGSSYSRSGLRLLGECFFLHFFAIAARFSLHCAPWRLLWRTQRTKQA